MFKSAVFPGLWLDAEALFHLDGRKVMEMLQRGMATPEYAVFVQQLQGRRGTS